MLVYTHVHVHVLMRDEEGRKQGQTNNKAKQNSTLKAVTFPMKMSCLSIYIYYFSFFSPLVLPQGGDLSLRGVRQQLYGCDGNTAEEHQEEAKVCELPEREVQGQQDKSVTSGAPTETCSEVSAVHPLPTGINIVNLVLICPVYMQFHTFVFL